MSPDEFQQAWKEQSPRPRVTVDAEALLEQLRRSQQDFGATILWRDIREAGISILLIPVWFFMGHIWPLPWTWYLAVPGLVFVSGFIIVDRMRQRKRTHGTDLPLLKCVEESLAQVEHQIWLLRNLLWWYLLPIIFPIFVYLVHTEWLDAAHWQQALVPIGGVALTVLLMTAVMYCLNQWVVRRQLEPRRQELRALLASLEDDDAGEVSGEYSILMQAKDAAGRPPQLLSCTVAFLLFLFFLSIGAVIFLIGYFFIPPYGHEYPYKSPFAAVQWQESQPEVKVGNEWFLLVALDGIPAEEIIAFSQHAYGDLWQKRFEEDLVELLTRMGHPPGNKVALAVQSIASSEVRILDDVPMTAANRRAIRNAAQARERGRP